MSSVAEPGFSTVFTFSVALVSSGSYVVTVKVDLLFSDFEPAAGTAW
jgi:hypothetical protein